MPAHLRIVKPSVNRSVPTTGRCLPALDPRAGARGREKTHEYQSAQSGPQLDRAAQVWELAAGKDILSCRRRDSRTSFPTEEGRIIGWNWLSALILSICATWR